MNRLASAWTQLRGSLVRIPKGMCLPGPRGRYCRQNMSIYALHGTGHYALHVPATMLIVSCLLTQPVEFRRLQLHFLELSGLVLFATPVTQQHQRCASRSAQAKASTTRPGPRFHFELPQPLVATGLASCNNDRSGRVHSIYSAVDVDLYRTHLNCRSHWSCIVQGVCTVSAVLLMLTSTEHK